MSGLVSKLDLGRLVYELYSGQAIEISGVNNQIKVIILKSIFNIKNTFVPNFELEKVFGGFFKSCLCTRFTRSNLKPFFKTIFKLALNH